MKFKQKILYIFFIITITRYNSSLFSMNNMPKILRCFKPAPKAIQEKANEITDLMIDLKYKQNKKNNYLDCLSKPQYKKFIKINGLINFYNDKKTFEKIYRNKKEVPLAFCSIHGIFYPEKISPFSMAHEIAHAIEPRCFSHNKEEYYKEYRAQELATYTLLKLKLYNEISTYKYKNFKKKSPYFTGVHDTLKIVKIKESKTCEKRNFFEHFEENQEDISEKYSRFLIFMELHKLLNNNILSKKDKNICKKLYKKIQSNYNDNKSLSNFIQIYKSTDNYKSTNKKST